MELSEEASLSPLHLETACRVLAEARKGREGLDEKRFVEFATDLKELREEYEGRLINDENHHEKVIKEELKKLRSACQRFRKVLRVYDEKEKPGTAYMNAAADLWHEQTKGELSRLEMQFRKLRHEQRSTIAPPLKEILPRVGRLLPLSYRKSRADDPILKVQDEIFSLDQDIQLFEMRMVPGMLAVVERGADLISEWIGIAFRVERDWSKKGLSWFQSTRDSLDYVPAQKWLIKEGIPQLYAAYFDPNHIYSFSVPPKKSGRSRKPCGPLINFVQAILSAFDVRSPETGKPVGPDRIGQLLVEARRERAAAESAASDL